MRHLKWICLISSLLVLLCCAAIASADVELNEVNFPDANFRQYIISAGFDTDRNGTLSEAELGNVKQIYCPSKSISDLTGIEHFAALTNLDCSFNELTSLDVSANTNLNRLVCFYNQLTSLDLTGNTVLLDEIAKYGFRDAGTLIQIGHYDEGSYGWDPLVFGMDKTVWVLPEEAIPDFEVVAIDEYEFPDENFRQYIMDAGFDANGNGSLSKTELGNVKEIYCASKSITSLKGIAYFRALTRLDCSSNQLTSLDVSRNTNLIMLSCYYNQLTSLDLTGNTVLLDEIAKYGFRDAGTLIQIGHFDEASFGWDPLVLGVDKTVSVLPEGTMPDYEIASIDEINFPDANFRQYIMDAGFDTNGNGSLSKAEIGNVKEIYCSSKSISDLTGIAYFTALTRLNCSSNQLTSLDVSQNTNLVMLSCFDNQLGSLDLTHNTKLLDEAAKYGLRDNGTIIQIGHFDEASFGWGPLVLEMDKSVSVLPEGAVPDYDIVAIDEFSFPDANFRQYIIDAGFDTNGNGSLSKAEIGNVTYIYCGSKSISDLTGIAYFTALTNLDVSYNQLTSLDVSKNTNLVMLSCFDNQLGSLDLTHNTKLLGEIAKYGIRDNGTIIQIGYLNEATYSWDPLVLEIDKKTSVLPEGTLPDYAAEVAEINEINFPDANFRQYIIDSGFDTDRNGSLSKAEIENVTSIYCSSKSISDLTGIAYFTALTRLDCSSNQLTSLDVSRNTSLIMLSCYNNQINTLDLTGNTKLLDAIAKYGLRNTETMIQIGHFDEASFGWDPLVLEIDKSVSVLPAGSLPELPSFILPVSTTTIESEAFAGLPNKVFQLPATVTFIAENAFDSSAIVYAPKGSYAETRLTELGITVVPVE